MNGAVETLRLWGVSWECDSSYWQDAAMRAVPAAALLHRRPEGAKAAAQALAAYILANMPHELATRGPFCTAVDEHEWIAAHAAVPHGVAHEERRVDEAVVDTEEGVVIRWGSEHRVIVSRVVRRAVTMDGQTYDGTRTEVVAESPWWRRVVERRAGPWGEREIVPYVGSYEINVYEQIIRIKGGE